MEAFPSVFDHVTLFLKQTNKQTKKHRDEYCIEHTLGNIALIILYLLSVTQGEIQGGRALTSQLSSLYSIT